MEALFGNVLNIQWQQVVMWVIGGLLIWLAIKKDMEPTLLLPMGFGAILVNLPLSGAVTQVYEGVEEVGVDQVQGIPAQIVVAVAGGAGEVGLGHPVLLEGGQHLLGVLLGDGVDAGKLLRQVGLSLGRQGFYFVTDL